MSSTTSILHQNNHLQHCLLFFFTSKTTPFHSIQSLHFKGQPILSFSSTTSSSSPQQSCLHITRVSTASIEYAPPSPDFNFLQEISRLKKLRSKLSVVKSLKQKLAVLAVDSRVKNVFNSNNNYLARFLGLLNLDSYQMFLIKCVLAAGLVHVLSMGTEFGEREVRSDVKTALYALVEMIERWDVNGSNGEAMVKRNDVVLENEQVKDLNKLLKSLAEMTHFMIAFEVLLDIRWRCWSFLSNQNLKNSLQTDPSTFMNQWNANF